MINVNDILRRLDETRLPKSELAKEIGIDSSNFTRWKNGKPASQDSLQKVKAYLDEKYPQPDWLAESSDIDERIERIKTGLNNTLRQIEDMGEVLNSMMEELSELEKRQYRQPDTNMSTFDSGK